jgi:hypothetical protein
VLFEVVLFLLAFGFEAELLLLDVALFFVEGFAFAIWFLLISQYISLFDEFVFAVLSA